MVAFGIAIHANAATIFVDSSAPSGGQNGTAANPFTTIQAAVAAAVSINEDVIFVGGGTTPKVYKPANQSSSIQIKDRIRIEGGYPGWNGSTFVTTGRDPDTYRTILSGDLNDDDIIGDFSLTNRDDNAAHVVVVPSGTQPPSTGSVAERVNLDGFEIRGGYKSATGGGGIRVLSGSTTAPVIRQCKIYDNMSGPGGGVYAESNSQPVFRKCEIYGNLGLENGGAAAHGASAQPKYLECTFSENHADFAGGAYGQDEAGSATFVSCKFLENSTDGNGGAVAMSYASSTWNFVNCLFVENTCDSDGGGAIVSSVTGTITITNCTFSQNDGPGSNGDAVRITAGAVAIRNSILWDNGTSEVAHTGGTATINHSNIDGGWSGSGSNNINSDPNFGADYRLECPSPSINAGSNSYVEVDTFDVDEDGVTSLEDAPDLDLGVRKIDTTVDMGAYERPFPLDTCGPRDIAPTGGDGCVGVPDLLAIINNWGPCPSPCSFVCGCAADVDNSHDCTVGVPDLLAILNNWGPCNGGSCPIGQTSPPSEIYDCMEICEEEEDFAGCVQKCLCGLGVLTEECD